MKRSWYFLICIVFLLCVNCHFRLMAQSLSSLKIIDAQFFDKKTSKPCYYVGANLGDISTIIKLGKADRAKVINYTALSLKKLGIKYAAISLQGMADSCTNKSAEIAALDELLKHFEKQHIDVTIGIPIPDLNNHDNYENKIQELIRRYTNTNSKGNSYTKSIIAWKLYKQPTSQETQETFYPHISQIVSWIKSIDNERMLTVSITIPTNNEKEQNFQSIMDTDGVDFVSIIANPYEIGWVTPSNLFSGLARVYIRMDERLDACNRIAQRVGKPYILDDVSYPRDAMARSIGTLSDARDSFLNYIFRKLSDSFQSQAPLSAILFNYDLLNSTTADDSDDKNDATQQNDWKTKAIFPTDQKSLEIVSSAINSLK